MIKGNLVLALDGSFKKSYPEPTAFSTRDGPKWKVTRTGPRYLNVYEVTEFDEAGEQWLVEHERKE